MNISTILDPISFKENENANYITEGLWTKDIVDFLYYNNSTTSNLSYEIYKGQVPSGGDPLVVRHGTDYVFDKFDVERLKSEKDAIFFVTDTKVAKGYGKNILECYISMANPCIVRFQNLMKPYTFESIVEHIRDQGYDGIITIISDSAYDGIDPAVDVYMVFSPNQVKIINKEEV